MINHQLQGLFDGSHTSGVYRLIVGDEDLTEALEAVGWFAAVLDEATTKREFLSHIGVVLGFPRHYGQNLDALWDCLTDLRTPTALVWTCWSHLAIEHPRDWAAIMDVLTERTRQQPPFALILS